jgi:ribosomal protein S6
MGKHAEMEMDVDDALENEGSGPRVYELGFHLDPGLPSEEVKKAYQSIRSVIAGVGSIVAEGDPQMIQLAYTISLQETTGRRDFDSAYFSWIVYETSSAQHAEVLASVTGDKRIIRFIDVLTTKEIARHSVEMRELSQKMPERTPDPAAAADVELDAALEEVAI